MSDLRAFMAKNMEPIEEVTYVASKRSKDPKTNKYAEWILKPITAKEDAELRKNCTTMVPASNKGQKIPQVDTNKYVAELVCACVVYPNLNDAGLQNSHHVMGASDLLTTMLLPGEYADLTAKVQQICGYDTTMEDMVKEAKN